MERLTQRGNDGKPFYPYCFNAYENEKCRECVECDFDAEICERLAQYEDLEEHGQLIKLPCKVGDTIFVKLNLARTIYKAEVRDFIHFISCGFCVVVTSDEFDKQKIPFSEFGKTVFLTREEAEQALKEMEGK